MFLSPTVAPPSRHPHQRHHHHCRGSAATKPPPPIVIIITTSSIPPSPPTTVTTSPPRCPHSRRTIGKGVFGTTVNTQQCVAYFPLTGQATRGVDVVVTKDQLKFMVNREIMEDALRVEDFKRMAHQLKNNVRRRSGYIGALKARSSGVGSNEDLKFMERMRLEDMEKGTHLLLMMKETEMKIGEKIAYVSSLGDDVAV
ncbi:hypothetical protein Tco_0723024 [Tanacetum coccineum]